METRLSWIAVAFCLVLTLPLMAQAPLSDDEPPIKAPLPEYLPVFQVGTDAGGAGRGEPEINTLSPTIYSAVCREIIPKFCACVYSYLWTCHVFNCEDSCFGA